MKPFKSVSCKWTLFKDIPGHNGPLIAIDDVSLIFAIFI